MTKSRWQSIWDEKGKSGSRDVDMPKMLFASGFTSDGKSLPLSAWDSYIDYILKHLNILPGSTILDAGCGNGAMTYPLAQKGMEMTGIDYSQSMVENCATLMPDIHFTASDILKTPFPDQSFDFVICNSVFLYLENEDEASRAMDEFLRVIKPQGGFAVLDVPDETKKEHYLNMKRQLIGEKYDELYKDLKQLFLNKVFFLEYARKNNLRSTVEDQVIQDYSNSPYRFNVFLKK